MQGGQIYGGVFAAVLSGGHRRTNGFNCFNRRRQGEGRNLEKYCLYGRISQE